MHVRFCQHHGTGLTQPRHHEGIALAPTFAVTSRTPLFTDGLHRSGTLDYEVLPDGDFVMLQPSTASQLIVITNWQSKLTKPRVRELRKAGVAAAAPSIDRSHRSR